MMSAFPVYVCMKPAPVSSSYTVKAHFTCSCTCPACWGISFRPNMLITIKNTPVIRNSIPARYRLNPPRYP